MDDLRLPTSKIGLQEMLQLLDGFPYQLSRRYANTWAAFSHVVITSNWSPDKQWQSMRNASSLRSPLSEEDKLAFYRRFTRVLHVDKHGKISDETAVYRNGVDEREHVTLDDLKSALSKPVLKNCLYDETDFQYSLDNLSIVSGS